MPPVLNSPLVRRGRIVLVNATRHLMVPAENLGAAWLVIVFRQADTVWGAFVGTQIVIGLTIQILSWGNKDWLLRRAADEPASAGRLWQGALWGRAGFLLPVLVLVPFFGYDIETALWVILWITSAFLVQSFDALILITRRFKTAIGVEIAAFSVVVILLLEPANLGETEVIRSWAIGSIIRAILLLFVLVRQLGTRFERTVEPGFLIAAAPFFVLGLSGMLQSKMDLYMANLFLDHSEVGRYQVIINTFIMLQAGGAFLVVPFAKTLYRAGEKAVRGFARLVFWLGVGLTILGIGASWFLLNRIYSFNLSVEWFALGGLLVFPVFSYLPRIYQLFRAGQERAVVVANLVGAGVNMLVSVALINMYGAIGALVGSVVAQWVTLLMILAVKEGVEDVGSLP